MSNSPRYIRKEYKKLSALRTESNLINETKSNKTKKYDRSSSSESNDKEIKLLNKKKKLHKETKDKTISKQKKKEVKTKQKKRKRTNRIIDYNAILDEIENSFYNHQNELAEINFDSINQNRNNNNNIQLLNLNNLDDQSENFVLDDDIFEDIFLELPLLDIFRRNYFSNFNPILLRPFELTLTTNEELNNNNNNNSNSNKPTSSSILRKLKKFDMNNNYCKKNSNGVLELPNCCICISEIKKKEKTVLLPCGHIYHWKCCSIWLKNNNTCPVCRFKLTEIN